MRIALLTLILGGATRLLATLPKDLEIGSMEVTIIVIINVTDAITESSVNIILSAFLVNAHFDQGRTKFSLVLVGGVLIEMGHPFVMIVATKVIAIKTYRDLQNRSHVMIFVLIHTSQTKFGNHYQILMIFDSS